MDKKQLQLGMNPSTASHRLVKDTLFRLAVEAGHVCFHCGLPLDRETFSIEHKIPWLDSDDPKANYFDQTNISFSHLLCNTVAARRTKSDVPERVRKTQWDRDNRIYNADRRRDQYLRTGK